MKVMVDVSDLADESLRILLAAVVQELQGRGYAPDIPEKPQKKQINPSAN